MYVYVVQSSYNTHVHVDIYRFFINHVEYIKLCHGGKKNSKYFFQAKNIEKYNMSVSNVATVASKGLH